MAFSPNITPFVFECHDCVYIPSELVSHNDPLAFISNGAVSTLAISSDGSLVASCTQCMIRLWDSSLRYRTWEEFYSAFHGQVMRMLASSPNGRYLAIMSLLGYTLVDYTGKVLCILDNILNVGYKPYLGKLRTRSIFSPDSSILAYWHESTRKVKLFSTKSGRHTQTLRFPGFRGRLDTIISVAFSPNSSSVACGYENGAIRVFTVKSGHTFAALDGHHQQVTSIAFSRDGFHIVSGSRDRSTRCWTLPTGECVGTFNHCGQEVTAAVFAPNSSSIVYVAYPRSISVWNIKSASMHSFAYVEQDIISLEFSDDSTRLFCRTGSENSTTYVWDFPLADGVEGKEQETYTDGGSEYSVLSMFGRNHCFCDYTMSSLYILQDGWIFDGKKRLCWVPTSLRPRWDSDFRGIKDGVLMRTNNDKVVILRFGQMYSL